MKDRLKREDQHLSNLQASRRVVLRRVSLIRVGSVNNTSLVLCVAGNGVRGDTSEVVVGLTAGGLALGVDTECVAVDTGGAGSGGGLAEGSVALGEGGIPRHGRSPR